MLNDNYLYLLCFFCYSTLSLFYWSGVIKGRSINNQKSPFTLAMLLITISIHGLAVHIDIIQNQQIHISWATGVSITLWLGMIVFWIESFFQEMNGTLLILLPMCAIFSLIPTLVHTNYHHDLFIPAINQLFTMHILLALSAYALVILAAIQAVIMIGLINYLRRPHSAQNWFKKIINQAIEEQPPLLVQERILFRLIGIGFFLLTIAIITGVMVSLQTHNTYFALDHKTVFTIFAWLAFLVLLIGRFIFAWSGRMALHGTLIGLLFMVLAYTGTRIIYNFLN